MRLSQSKRFLVWLLVVGLAMASGLTLWQASHLLPNNFTPVTQQQLSALQAALTPPSPSPTVVPQVLGTVDARGFEQALVKSAVDGDTIELADGRTVRYIGVDTPETKHPTKGVQCFGKEASRRNKELVEGQVVSLEKDVSETDRYGRLLRYVWKGEQLINAQLVAEGLAFSRSYPPDIAQQSLFRDLETAARQQQIGLWGSCEVLPLE